MHKNPHNTIRDDRSEFCELLQHHDREFRDPSEVVGYWQDFHRIDPRVLKFHTAGNFWRVLEDLNAVLLVSREYEHLLLALSVRENFGPEITMMRIPHPSGIAVDHHRKIVHVASTRNPNQLYQFMPVDSLLARSDILTPDLEGKPLFPLQTRFLPGCLYIHDLAIVDNCLHANAVGQNSVIRISSHGMPEKVWWPKCIEIDGCPQFDANFLQVNSIAAGTTIKSSFFSASTDTITTLRPGNPDFPVNGRGVIFSGASGEPIVRGLTRPHSARLHNSKIWIDNSGYGQVGCVEGTQFRSVAVLPGWTRGLCFKNNVAFVGVSRVLPKFSKYAPGLKADSSECGVYALDVKSERVLGAVTWPHGSQIFAVEAVSREFCTGLPFGLPGRGDRDREQRCFYSFQVPEQEV